MRHNSNAQTCPNQHPDFKEHPAFELIEPQTTQLPFLINSPHSGTHYPKSFTQASRLSKKNIRRSEDTWVDELFKETCQTGATFLKANFPRAYLDVNREPYELDPDMFLDPLPSYANTNSFRVAGGLGTIARIVAQNHNIYAQKLTVEEALSRIEHIYKPYHAALRKTLAKLHAKFSRAYLIDCHSMPSSQQRKADIILGNRYGESCDVELAQSLTLAFKSLGYKLTHNKPYAGGFITKHYGRPARNLHSIQIEINRALYMNERTFEKNQNFDRLQTDLNQIMQTVFKEIASRETIRPLAAE